MTLSGECRVLPFCSDRGHWSHWEFPAPSRATKAYSGPHQGLTSSAQYSLFSQMPNPNTYSHLDLSTKQVVQMDKEAPALLKTGIPEPITSSREIHLTLHPWCRSLLRLWRLRAWKLHRELVALQQLLCAASRKGTWTLSCQLQRPKHLCPACPTDRNKPREVLGFEHKGIYFITMKQQQIKSLIQYYWSFLYLVGSNVSEIPRTKTLQVNFTFSYRSGFLQLWKWVKISLKPQEDQFQCRSFSGSLMTSTSQGNHFSQE
jgi:hypothetical protein